MEGIKVLSLFDGKSGGQIALDNLGVIVKNYYASEIDKHAIKVTQHNFPNTMQLGSVTNVKGADLPTIDILIGGSPCQSFSFAGKQKGMSTKCEKEILTLDYYLELKDEGYEFEGQSYLFWEYIRLLKETNPTYFLLENVKMSKKWEGVISNTLGIEPIEINSAKVSGQNRKRLYWTNIKAEPYGLFGDLKCMIPQPKDKGILLKDILETDVPDKYYLSEKMIKWLTTHSEKRGTKFKQLDGNQKASCLTTTEAKQNLSNDYICVASRDRSVQTDNVVIQLNQSMESGGKQPYQQNRVYDVNGISPALLSQMSCGTHAILVPEATKKGFAEINPGECFDFENPKSKTRRGRKMEDKSNCLMAKETDFMTYTNDYRVRRLTPTECKRLQTVPDWYDMSIVSDTQKYRMLGNGWTVDVIAHILSFANFKTK